MSTRRTVQPIAITAGVLLALAGSVLPINASSGPYLVKDINTSGSSNPSGLTEMDGIVYFSAKGGGKGYELWRSDGTSTGTWRVKDIRSGGGSSFPYGLRAIAGRLYFIANDGTHGSELWSSDGTGPGTRMIKDIYPGSSGSSPYGFVMLNGIVYFAARENAAGRSLWRTDGTSNGTYRVSNLSSDPLGDIWQLTPFAGKLFFVVSDVNGSGTLYRTDGTASGTKPFKNKAGHLIRGDISGLSIVGSNMYFSRARPDLGSYEGELWRSKGTAQTTKKIADLAASLITDVDGTAFFRTYEATVDTQSGHLWKTDGSSATTVLVRDFDNNGGLGWAAFAAIGQKLIFDANENFGQNDQLWTSDGTTAATQPVGKQVRVDQDGVVLGSVLYFGGYSDDEDGECAFSTSQFLWRSDGTASGTYDVDPSASYCPENLTAVGDSIYFTSRYGGHGVELWRYVP